MESYSLPTPDWVILGVGGGPDGSVAVYASRTLRTAEVNVEHPEPEYDAFRGVWRQLEAPTITISATSPDMVIAYGADYREAVAELFKMWEPAAAPRPALPSATWSILEP